MKNEVEVLSAWVLVKDKEGMVYLKPATGEDMIVLADRMMREMGIDPITFAPGKPGKG